MTSFNHFSRMFLGFSLLTAGSIIGGACSVKLSADFAPEATSVIDDRNDLAGGGTGVTSGGSTSGVHLPPPNDATKASSFTYLCGDGCMSEDKSHWCPSPTNPDNPPSTSCQIVPTAIGPTAECLTPGLFQEGEPCEKASNCAASLGCVRMGSEVGVCRAYCCGDIEACAPGTYCTLGAMTEDAMTTGPMRIPVCAPATPCTLLDDTTCNPGLTCTLVRKDGTTSCVEPGLGKQGDACPCSAGQVCLLSSGTCRALCHLGGNDCPNEALCQGGSEGFPDGIGLCVK